MYKRSIKAVGILFLILIFSSVLNSAPTSNPAAPSGASTAKPKANEAPKAAKNTTVIHEGGSSAKASTPTEKATSGSPADTHKAEAGSGAGAAGAAAGPAAGSGAAAAGEKNATHAKAKNHTATHAAQPSGFEKISEGLIYPVVLNTSHSMNFSYEPRYAHKDEIIHVLANPVKESIATGVLDLKVTSTIVKTNVTTGQSEIYSVHCLDISFEKCEIKTTEFKKEKVRLDIQLTCFSGPCFVNLRILEEKEIDIFLNRPYVFRFNRLEKEDFRFPVPEKKDFKRLVLTITLHNRESLFHKVIKNLTLSTGTPQIFENHNKVSIALSSDDKTLCEKCMAILSLNIEMNTILTLDFRTFEEVQRIPADFRFVDYLVSNNAANVYELLLSEYDADISFKLRTYGGRRKLLFVHPDVKPGSVDEFKYKNDPNYMDYYVQDDSPEEDLVIDTQDLNATKLYVAVSGEAGFFTLEIISRSARFYPISVGRTEHGTLFNGEEINYEVQVWADSELDTMSIDIGMVRGHVAVYVHSCERQMPCRYLTPNMLKGNQSEIPRLVSRESHSHELITVSPDCKELAEDGFCRYAITLFANSTQSETVKYQLTVRQRTSHVDLQENVPIHGEIEPDQSHYYRFFLVDTADVEQIVVRISEPHLKIYASTDRQCEQPTASCSSSFANIESALEIDKKDIHPGFRLFIAVTEAERIAKYSLVVEVVHKGENVVFHLWEGQPFAYELRPERNLALFKFHVHFLKKTDIEINVESPRDELEIYVTNSAKVKRHELGNATIFDNFHWFSSSQHMTISSKSPFYTKKGTYYILVRAQSVEEQNSLRINFRISYATSRTIRHLSLNSPYYDTLRNSSRDRQFVAYLRATQHVVINAFPISYTTDPNQEGEAPIQMTISSKPFAKTDDPHTFKVKEVSKNENDRLSITLDSRALKQLCSKRRNHCPVYIQVHSNLPKEDVLYSLNVEHPGSAMKVVEGFEQNVKFVYEDGNFIRGFYFVPRSHKLAYDLEIKSLYGTTTQVTVTIFENPARNWKKVKNSPKTKTLSFTSSSQSQHSIHLSSEHMREPCHIHCLVHFTVRAKFTVDSPQEDFLSLYTSSEETMLVHGQHRIFNLKPRSGKDFIFNLKDLLVTKTDLVLSLSALSGSASIDVQEFNDGIIGDVDPKKLSELYQGSTSENHLIVPWNVIRSQPESNPMLLIKVFSVDGGRFIIEGDTGDVLQLHTETPRSVTIPENFESIYEIRPTEPNLRVKISRDAGEAVASLYQCRENIVFSECLHSQPLKQEIIANVRNVFNIPPSKIHYYLLVVVSKTKWTGQISLVSSENYDVLSTGTSTVDSVPVGNLKLYKLVFQPQQELEVSISVLNGNPKVNLGLAYESNNPEYFTQGQKGLDSSITLNVDQEHIVNFLQRLNTRIGNYSAPLAAGKNKPNGQNSAELWQPAFLNLFIQVESGDISANYTVSVRVIDSVKSLKAGVMETFTLVQGEKIRFIYNSQLPYVKSKQFLALETPSVHLHSDLDNLDRDSVIVSVIYYQKLGEKETIEAKTNSTASLFSTIQGQSFKSSYTILTKNSMNFELPLKNGTFEITISNKRPQTLRLSLLISGQGINLIPFDTQFAKSIRPTHYDFFELYIPHPGNLAMDFIQCMGDVEVVMTKNLSHLYKRDFETHLSVTSQRDTVNSVEIKSAGMYYLGVRNMESGHRAFYHMNLHLYKKNTQILQEKIQVGNAGQLRYFHTPSEDKIELLFEKVTCHTCKEEELQNAEVEYVVLISRTLAGLNLEGHCGMKLEAATREIAKEEHQTPAPRKKKNSKTPQPKPDSQTPSNEFVVSGIYLLEEKSLGKHPLGRPSASSSTLSGSKKGKKKSAPVYNSSLSYTTVIDSKKFGTLHVYATVKAIVRGVKSNSYFPEKVGYQVVPNIALFYNTLEVGGEPYTPPKREDSGSTESFIDKLEENVNWPLVYICGGIFSFLCLFFSGWVLYEWKCVQRKGRTHSYEMHDTKKLVSVSTLSGNDIGIEERNSAEFKAQIKKKYDDLVAD